MRGFGVFGRVGVLHNVGVFGGVVEEEPPADVVVTLSGDQERAEEDLFELGERLARLR